jgi:glutaredoxin
MKVFIYSKEGCTYCDHAVTLCETESLEYEKVMVSKDKLKEICGESVTNYPQIYIDDRHVGTYFDFQDYIENDYEPILAPTLNRFTVFPLKYPHLWELYKKAQMSNWTAEEVDFSKDIEDWRL